MRSVPFQALLLCLVAGRAAPQGVHQADLQKVLASDGLAGDEFGSCAAMHGVIAVVGAPLHDHAGLPDCGAAYVYVFDGTSWSEEAELVAADAASLDQFGVSVDVDNDTIVVGAWKESNPNGLRAGAAYVFVRSGTTWSQQAKLVASDGDPDDEFGRSVAVSGDGVLVGAHHEDAAGTDSGSVYVFVRGGTSWLEAQKLVASDAAAGDEVGAAVALDGTIAAIGAPLHDAGVADSGAVYMYEHDGTGLVEQAKLTAPAPGIGDTLGALGASLAVSGDKVVAGSPRAGVSGDNDSGRAYVWARSGTSWALQDELDPSSFHDNDELGASVALDGEKALVGAHLRNLPQPAGLDAGTAYVFQPQGALWQFLGVLTADDAAAGDRYGSSVALAGDRALVGARLDDDTGADAGSVYFLRMVPTPGILHEAAKLVAPDGGYADSLGLSVAVHGDTALAGAPYDDTVGGTSAGSAYVFVRSGTSWLFEAKLRAADGSANDLFGISAAISGSTAVIGAYLDDPGGNESGSAYVFVRSGTSWSQEAKLVAADAAAGDEFGWSVALEGDTAFIGSPGDDDAGNRSGSAYVFVRSGTSWSQEAKWIAVDAAASDEFGSSIAVYGPTVVVGSPLDDDAGSGSGSAYVFVRSGTIWGQQAKLVASDGEPEDELGRSVAVWDDRVLVGAHLDDDAGNSSGSAYLFVRNGTSWLEARKLVASDAQARDEFGASVAIDGDKIVIGSPLDDDWGNGSGAAYVFTRLGTSWSQQAKLIATDAAGADELGWSVALDGETAVIGAPGDGEVGAGYVFTSLDPFLSFCDASDGSLDACPCGNPGSPDSGCDIAQGTGGVRLDVEAQQYVPQNRATLVGTGYPPASLPSAVVIRAGTLDRAGPVVFGDGLRCIGTPLVRLGATTAIGGTSVHAIGHGTMGGTYYYQLWFRNQPAMFCTPDAFNLSNGRALAW